MDGWTDGMGWDGMGWYRLGGHHEFCDRWGDQSGQGGSCNENTTIKTKVLATQREESKRLGPRVQPLLQ